jgi:hypothetical protein|tara:strand:+ start:5299 stop:5493 length:195 start_codon:yes stop_codon:yes gene_type:complete
MKVGDLIRVNTRNPIGGVHRWQLGVIIAFAARVDKRGQDCHVMLMNGSKVSIETGRLEVVNESR